MEYKIGEIFEEDGKWYQCLEGHGCNDCGKCDKLCVVNERSDKTSVTFKELEKIGEPYEYVVHNRGIVMLQPYKLFTTPIINGVVCNVHYDSNTIDLEIKQSKKEDMKINRVVMDIDDRDYLLDRLEEILHDTHCQQYKDEICEALSKYIVTETAPGLKPFDLEAAKSGRPVCTRDGRKARIICLDSSGVRPMVALVAECEGEEEIPYKYHYDGSYNCSSISSDYDLMMTPKVVEGWVNIYRDCDGANITKDDNIYSSKDAAIASAKMVDRDNYVSTTKIKWEE